MSVMPRLARAGTTSGWARIASSTSWYSSTVKCGVTPGTCVQDSTTPSVRSTTPSQVWLSARFHSTANAVRRTGSPARHAFTSALGGSSSSIEANLHVSAKDCSRRRMAAVLRNSSSSRGSSGCRAISALCHGLGDGPRLAIDGAQVRTTEATMSEKKTIHNIIDGEVQASASGALMDIINPSTGEVYATAPNSDEHDVDLAFRAAGKAFESWRWTTPSERQQALLKLADVIEQNADELVAVESENTGKPVNLTLSEEIPPMVDQIRFFAGAARVLEGKSSGEYMRGHT